MKTFAKIMFALTLGVIAMKLATNAQAQSVPRQQYENYDHERAQYQYELRLYDRGTKLRQQYSDLYRYHSQLSNYYRYNRTWETYDRLVEIDRQLRSIDEQIRSIDRYIHQQNLRRQQNRRTVNRTRSGTVNSNLIRILNENRNRTVRVPGGGPTSVARSRQESLRGGR